MSSFFEAAFAKSTVRLAESDNMAALDAEFYDATAKITDEDLKDPDLKLFQQAKQAPKQQDCSKITSKKKRKRCEKKNKKLVVQLPSVCSDGLTSESCLASMMEKAKACQKHKECSIDACKIGESYGDAQQSLGKGCPQKCFEPVPMDKNGNPNLAADRAHYIGICDSVLDNIREAYKELKKESGDPRFQ